MRVANKIMQGGEEITINADQIIDKTIDGRNVSLSRFIKIKRYSAVVDISITSTSSTISTSVPLGYSLIGYLIGGIYLDSAKSNQYDRITASIVNSGNTRVVLAFSNGRGSLVSNAFVEVVGIYAKI